MDEHNQWLMLEILSAAEGSTNRGKWGGMRRALAIRRITARRGRRVGGMGNGEWGVASGEWGVMSGLNDEG